MQEKQPNGTLPAIADDQLITIAEQAEKRIEAVRRIKTLALKLTNPGDWVDQQGKPYLQASGAEKIARLFGISWRISEPIREESEDGYFQYTYKGEFCLAGASIEAVGSRNSKDGFFSRRKGQTIPASEIDQTDVKKAAYTNLLGNGITRLLGIRNLTYDDLKTVGITKQMLTQIEYRKKPPLKQSSKPDPKPDESPPPPNGKLKEAADRTFKKDYEDYLGELGTDVFQEVLDSFKVKTPEELPEIERSTFLKRCKMKLEERDSA